MSKRKARINRRKWWKQHNDTVYSVLLGISVLVGLFIALSLVRG